MRKLMIFVALTAALTATALGQSERIGARQWKLVQVDRMRVADSSNAYIELNTDQRRFTGNTGCNRMFGSADINGRRVDFSNIGTTKMACLQPRIRRVETAFVRALENVDRFRQRGNSLELYDRNRLVIKLTAMTKQPPDTGDGRLDLDDRKWMLEAVKGVPVSKNGRSAFVVFDAEKRSAGGNSSCNVFGGSYTAKGSTLKITDVISTMRACVEDDRMAIEREFLNGLREANRYEIRRGKLMLYRSNRLLLTLDGQAK